MTAPLVQAPQPQSSVGNLLPLIMHISEARQHLAMERERLDLDKQRTQAELLRGETLDAEAKARLKQAQLKLDAQIQENSANDVVAQHMHALVLAPNAISPDGTFNPNVVSKARVDMLKNIDPKLSSDAIKKFEETVTSLDQQLGQHFQAQRAASEARVALATEGSRIQSALLEPKTKEAQIAAEKSRELSELTSRETAALNAWAKIGGQYGRFREHFGLDEHPGGIKDTEVFQKTGAAALLQRAKIAGPLLVRGNILLDQFKDQSLGKLAADFVLQDRPVAEILTNSQISEHDKRVATAYIDLSFAMVNSLYTGRVSSQTRLDLLRSIIQYNADQPKVRNDKRFLRKSFVLENAATAAGKQDPIQAADRMIDLGQKLGISPEAIAALNEHKKDMQRLLAADGDSGASNSSGMMQAQALADSLGIVPMRKPRGAGWNPSNQ